MTTVLLFTQRPARKRHPRGGRAAAGAVPQGAVCGPEFAQLDAVAELLAEAMFNELTAAGAAGQHAGQHDDLQHDLHEAQPAGQRPGGHARSAGREAAARDGRRRNKNAADVQ